MLDEEAIILLDNAFDDALDEITIEEEVEARNHERENKNRKRFKNLKIVTLVKL